MGLKQLKQQLAAMADPEQAVQLQRYFKTGPGQYGEGDHFFGIRMPQLRRLARGYVDLNLSDLAVLLQTTVHEQRMTALLILTYQFPKAEPDQQKAIFNFYMANTAWINNWDLVDVTVTHIVGAFLLTRSRRPLFRLAQSDDIWERRIAIVATLAFIRIDQFEDTLHIADQLLADPHDLIHKAVGWMVREVGKRDLAVMEAFLQSRYARMPRTMLRYAIEKLPEQRRQDYLKGRI